MDTTALLIFLPLSPLLLATILGNLQIFPVPITQPRHDKTRPHLLENVREPCTTQNDGIQKLYNTEKFILHHGTSRGIINQFSKIRHLILII